MAKIKAFNGQLDFELTDQLRDLIKELDSEGSIVKLNEDNSKIIEAKIKNDEGYTDYGRITFDYYYKDLCCLEENSKKNKNKENELKRKYMDILRGIDIVNSTNVWRYDSESDHKEMKQVRDYIVNHKQDFNDSLKKGDLSLVNRIRCASIIDNINDDFDIINEEEENRGEHSFASKVCKYFDEYIHENSSPENKSESYYNKYYIDDHYVRAMLPYYLYFYKDQIREVEIKNCQFNTNCIIEKNVNGDTYELIFKHDEQDIVRLSLHDNVLNIYADNIRNRRHCQKLNSSSTTIINYLCYRELFGLLEILRVISGCFHKCNLTRSQLDHIIWYCYKSYDK